jgi:hypothetical protein
VRCASSTSIAISIGVETAIRIVTAIPSASMAGSRPIGSPYHQTIAARAIVWLASRTTAASPSGEKRPQGLGSVLSTSSRQRRACPGDPDQDGAAVPT